MSDRPTKISFGEMQDSGVRGILVYRADCHDCDQRDRSPRASEYACKRSRGFRSGARTCQPVWILSYCGFDPLMGRPFALKSGRPCQPREIALPTKNRSCSRRRFV